MRIEPGAMKEIHGIRDEIYEKIKNMPERDVSDFYANAARDVEKMYGVEFLRPESKASAKRAI